MSESANRRIPVRDGVHLAARIWSPPGQGPFPAILEALPYRKCDRTVARDATMHPAFARAGYVSVRLDLRGCGESDGLFDDEYSEQELCDIEDVIAWIAAQEWSSGAVGMMGISWGGFNGLQVAARRPEALKAVISLCSSVDRFADDIHYKGGCELTENIGWAATVMSWFSMPPDPALRPDWREVWLERLEATPFLASTWLRHRTRDSYWRHGSVCEDFTGVEAPVLSIGGWHDGYRNTPVKLLEGGTSGPVKAIVGPWNHKYPHMAAPGPQVDFVAMALRWWDRWLKGIENGADADPDYRAYVMEAVPPATSYSHRPGRWVALEHWPAGGMTQRGLTLGNGTLGGTAMTRPASVDTQPACGQGTGEYFPFGFGPGELPDDQQADDALSLCFDAAPLDAPLTLLGAARLHLRLASDQSFGQIAARLSDVAPDGQATLIAHGFLNLPFREGFETAKALTPGTPCDIALDLDQMAYRLPAGHRLRLALSPSYWPFIWPAPGAVTLTVHDGTLTLPILPEGTGTEITLPPAPDSLPEATRQTRPGTERKNWTHGNGRHTLTLEADHGETLIPDTGLSMTSALREVWSIDAMDVADARAQIDWDRGLARGDWQVRTRVETRMKTDAEAVYVSMWLAAYVGDTVVFTRKFHDTVPHNGDPRFQQDSGG